MSTDPLFMKIGSEYYWYHNDHLGTPQMMTTSSGAVVWKAKYTAFGKATVDPISTVISPLRMPGQYEDEETGLHYNFYRYYEAEIGRYLKIDPIGYYGGINMYVYARVGPISSMDPFGLKDFGIGGVLNGTVERQGLKQLKQVGIQFDPKYEREIAKRLREEYSDNLENKWFELRKDSNKFLKANTFVNEKGKLQWVSKDARIKGEELRNARHEMVLSFLEEILNKNPELRGKAILDIDDIELLELAEKKDRGYKIVIQETLLYIKNNPCVADKYSFIKR